jgi:hypothetical protein
MEPSRERVCMDNLSVGPCKGGIGNILVITDHFTKFSVVLATKNETAKTTAEVLLDHFFSDMEFHQSYIVIMEQILIKELCT